MIVNFNNVGKVGLIKDAPSYMLPQDAWSSVTNIRFNDNYAEKSKGHSEPFGTPSIAPYYLMSVQSSTVQYWIYAGLTSVYVTSGSSHFNISGTTYGTTLNDGWNGGMIGDIAILNNGINPPQYWATASPSVNLADLANWPANTTCKVMRPFKNYLIAMNVTKPGGDFHQLVKWSHPASPGIVPSSWDETDTTKDAGETTLAQGGGHIVDGAVLGDIFYIYKEWSVWEMRFIGGRFIFQFREVFNNFGALAVNCVVEFNGKHCVLTANDLIVHDGRTSESILDSRMRDALFDNMDSTYAQRTFLAANYQKNEIWICYPETGEISSTKALVWNYRHNTFGYRTLPGSRHIAFNVIDATSSGTIDSFTDTIDSYTSVYDESLFDPSKGRMLMADTKNTKLFEIDATDQFNGTSFTSTLQRTGLDFGKIDEIKRIKRILPRIEASSGTTIGIKIGTQSVPEGTISWSSSKTFTVGTDYKIDISNDNNAGRLLAVEFETTGNVAWKLHGFDLDVDLAGKQ